MKEIREILNGTGWNVLSLKDAGIDADIEENGTTFEENAKIKAEGPKRRLVGFELTERGIPRHGYKLADNGGGIIGEVTSGTMSPCLKKGIGMGYVAASHAAPGSEINVIIREKPIKAVVVKLPFIKK